MLYLFQSAQAWLESLAASITNLDYRIVGCTTSYEQTASSLALLRQIKLRSSSICTILGGANCEGEMGSTMAEIAPWIDVVFSGEAEQIFVKFLRYVTSGQLPPTRLMEGTPCNDLDALPTPDYEDYYTQLDAWLPDCQLLRQGQIWLSYETSRGCWWGEKQHCTFCGLNGEGMAFRQKSPDRIIADLKQLSARHLTNRITMVDNIMPHRFFHSLLPRLADERLGLHIFYEQKANLDLRRVLALRAAGIVEIQPGIEALSTPLLQRMAKGTTAGQNVALLRYARAAHLSLSWNLLHGFPNEEASWYTETIQLIPLLRHLPPPDGVLHISIDRFSPYFAHPDRYGIGNVRPLDAYREVFPADAPVARLAYHFTGDYPRVATNRPELAAALIEEADRWKHAWQDCDVVPVLTVARLTCNDFLLIDTRGIGGMREIEFITFEQALAALTKHVASTPSARWAFDRKCAVELDGRYVPLAVATPDLLLEMEQVNAGELQAIPG